MKNLIILFSIVLLTSCGSGNTVFVPSLNKRVKVFKNDTFQIYYPKKWVKFDEGETFHSKPAISIAPQKKIYNAYRIKKKIYGKTRNINLSEADKKIYPNTDFDKALKGKDAWAKVLIDIKKSKLIDEVVSKYSEYKIESSRYKNFKISKISDVFYIISYRVKGKTRKTGYNFGDSVFKIYIKQHGNDVYQVIYKASQYSYNDYKDDASLILRSFKFLE